MQCELFFAFWTKFKFNFAEKYHSLIHCCCCFRYFFGVAFELFLNQNIPGCFFLITVRELNFGRILL